MFLKVVLWCPEESLQVENSNTPPRMRILNNDVIFTAPFKFSWFLFSRIPTCPPKTRNFAPRENFPLYGMLKLRFVVPTLYINYTTIRLTVV